jgi:hypothetical protein
LVLWVGVRVVRKEVERESSPKVEQEAKDERDRLGEMDQ